MSDRITPQALTYIANDFACNAEHPADRERLKEVVRAALDQAADALARLQKERDYAVRWANTSVDSVKEAADAEIASLRALLAQAEGALEPFAKEGQSNWSPSALENMEQLRIKLPTSENVYHAEFSLADCATAASTLAAIRAAKEKTDA